MFHCDSMTMAMIQKCDLGSPPVRLCVQSANTCNADDDDCTYDDDFQYDVDVDDVCGKDCNLEGGVFDDDDNIR